MNFSLKKMLLAFILVSNFNIFATETIEIKSEILVSANKKDSFELLKNLERFKEWSPFIVTDPKQKNYVTGKLGEIGSTFFWEGVGEKSKGKQVLTKMDDLKSLLFECTIEEPFQGNPNFEYLIEEKDNQTKIIQNFKLTTSNIDYFFIWLFGVKSEMKEVNKLGLERFKTLIEKETLEKSGKNNSSKK